jgi:hypothetical protein
MTRRKRTRRTTESWEVKADKPGLTPELAVEPWDLPLLVSQVVSESSAALDSADKQTWRPVVIVTVKGRWNRTDEEAEIKLILPADSALPVAEGLIGAGAAAVSDAAAEQIRSGLDGNGGTDE